MELWTGALSWWKCHWTDWTVLDTSRGIPSWTPLKPQHRNPNPNPYTLANQLGCIDFLTPPTHLIISQRLPAFLESLIPLKNWCSIHARWTKSGPKQSIRFCVIFSKFKTEFYCISFFWSVLMSRLHFWYSPAVTIMLYLGVFQLLLYIFIWTWNNKNWLVILYDL